MADESIDDPAEAEADDQVGAEDIEAGMELPVKIDTLSLDGTQPEIGDDVDVKVSGRLTRIRDDVAYISLQQANGEPIENPAKQPEDEPDEDDMMNMAATADQAGRYPP